MIATSYSEFIESKQSQSLVAGFDGSAMPRPPMIREFQSDVVDWALKRGRAAIFADTGLGKTLMQLTWANCVAQKTGMPVLILTPLCVAQQTVREGFKFGIGVEYQREYQEGAQIIVTNYEMLNRFDSERFGGLVVDESSILKGLNGKVRKEITGFATKIPYRLSCTATPSPNDFMELGTQCEFLGIMSQVEMLATYFIHDGSDTSKWRLKGHARKRFWEWMSTWAAVIRKPSDLGYESDGYDLPELNLIEHIVETAPTDDLFATVAMGLQERNTARRESINERCAKAVEIMSDWDCGIAWCNLNAESDLIADMSGAINIQGSDSVETKEKNILAFTDGEVSKIVTKPKIAGFGLNWQHCNKMVFVGLSDSFESFYQAVRRCWRFGQGKPVEVHIVISDREGAVLDNIKRKQRQHDQMAAEMQKIMRDLTLSQIKGATIEKAEYQPKQEMQLPNWILA